MNAQEFRTAVDSLPYGKRLPGAVYLLDPRSPGKPGFREKLNISGPSANDPLPPLLRKICDELRARLEIGPEFKDADTGRVFARIDENFATLANPVERELIRRSLISRYFPTHSGGLTLQFLDGPETTEERVAEERGGVIGEAPMREEEVRSSAFRKTVVEAYDFQCAACGLRIRLQPGDLTFVDAAHVIPFEDSHNDHPSNGIALCKNHHWAMDRFLIAPGPDHIWHASGMLDERRSPGEASLLHLAGKRLLQPKEIAYHPSREALEWRAKRLRA